MNYIDAIAGQLKARIGEDNSPPELLRIYALLVLATGTKTTPENVHDAWAAWRATTKPEHPDLIPFAELTPEVIAWDLPYRDAIVAVAAELEFARRGKERKGGEFR